MNTIFLILVILILLIKLIPYITFKKPIMPRCIKCHQTLNENTFNTKGWKYINDKIGCIDHAFIDGKILQNMNTNLNNKLDESLLNKPPSEYFYSKRIDELNIDGFTKYEVFCYYLGKELKKKYPQILYLQHFVMGHKKSNFIFLFSNDLKKCKTSIRKLEKIKENKKCINYFSSTNFKNILNENFYKKKLNELKLIDWRWFYPYVTINQINVNINGLKLNDQYIYIVRNNTYYYAINGSQ